MTRRLAMPILVALVTLHGALLRLDALHAKYGWMDRPSWVAAVEARAVPVARRLRPARVAWGPISNPYVGGDPVNYLLYAREMQSFYQAHVREPVFLALTRGVLEAMQNRDVALSFASATAGTLAIPATYLLGSLYAPIVGLAAAAALAIEFDAITWSVDGWRDDTFMLVVTLATWALIRLRRAPSARNIALAATLGALAALTRITALSFLLPALVYAAWRSERPRSDAVRRVALTAAVLIALVLPYLVNCARATGDPFFAINYHTRYYRAAEQLPADESVGAFRYVWNKFAARPIQSLDTAFVGLVVFPYRNKWNGFGPWAPHLGPVLFWSGAAGLLLATARRDGRLLLLIVLSSLVPYAMTWSVGGGGEWRFTQHVYPHYLVAAVAAPAVLLSGIRAAWRRRFELRSPITWTNAAAAGALGAAVLVGYGWYRFAPLAVFREALAAGDAANVMTGDRDGAFFPNRWSDPHPEGTVVVRAALADRVSVRVPVPRRRTSYRVTLRMDPAETADPALQPRVTAYFNGRIAAQLHLRRHEGRVGTYRFIVPPEMADWHIGRLDLVASHTVPAADAGAHFSWLAPATPVAFRLWYVRVEPGVTEAAGAGTDPHRRSRGAHQ